VTHYTHVIGRHRTKVHRQSKPRIRFKQLPCSIKRHTEDTYNVYDLYIWLMTD